MRAVGVLLIQRESQHATGWNLDIRRNVERGSVRLAGLAADGPASLRLVVDGPCHAVATLLKVGLGT